MANKDFEQKLFDLAEGSLTSEEEEAFNSLLHNNPRLQKSFETYQKVLQAEKALKSEIEPVSASFAEEVLTRIEKHKDWRTYLRGLIANRYFLASCGALAVLVLAFDFTIQNETVLTPSRSALSKKSLDAPNEILGDEAGVKQKERTFDELHQLKGEPKWLKEESKKLELETDRLAAGSQPQDAKPEVPLQEGNLALQTITVEVRNLPSDKKITRNSQVNLYWKETTEGALTTLLAKDLKVISVEEGEIADEPGEAQGAAKVTVLANPDDLIKIRDAMEGGTFSITPSNEASDECKGTIKLGDDEYCIQEGGGLRRKE